MTEAPLKHILEAALLAAGEPVSLERLQGLFGEGERPGPRDLRAALAALEADYAGRGLEIAEVANGFRIQVRASFAPRVAGLWAEKPGRYSRALLETLAIIAYRQPITRSEIEEIRGVTVSSNIVRTLQERGWVRVLGHRDLPGRPATLGTTRTFLDYFGLRSLEELPTMMEVRDPEAAHPELDLRPADERSDDSGDDGAA